MVFVVTLRIIPFLQRGEHIKIVAGIKNEEEK